MSKESLLQKLEDNLTFNEMLIDMLLEYNNQNKYDNITRMSFHINRLAAALMYHEVLEDLKEQLEKNISSSNAEVN